MEKPAVPRFELGPVRQVRVLLVQVHSIMRADLAIECARMILNNAMLRTAFGISSVIPLEY